MNNDDKMNLLAFLEMAANAAKEDRQRQADEAAKCHAELINAYLNAGFTRKEAIQITTQMLVAGLNTKPTK